MTSEQTFLLQAGSDTVPVRTQIIGDRSRLQLPDRRGRRTAVRREADRHRAGPGTIEKIPGRMERVECGQPFGVFVDYAHTPDALASVLRSLRAVTPGRLICVFGAGGERDRDKRPLMAQAVEAASPIWRS